MIDATAEALSRRRHKAVRAAFVTLGAVAIAFAGATDLSFRVAGLVLTLAGIGTVAWNVAETRKSIQEPGFIAAFMALLRRTRGASVTAGAGRAEMTGFPARVGQSTWQEEIASLREQVQRDKHTMSVRQDKLEADQAAQDQRTKEAIRNMANAGLDLTAVGVLWLIVGSVLTAIPDVMAAFDHRLAGWLLFWR